MNDRISIAIVPTQVAPELLSRENFAQYGEVVEPGRVADGRRILGCFEVASSRAETRCWVSTFEPIPDRSIIIDRFEAHPHSAQAFVALQPCQFVVVVAQTGPDGLPDVATCRAFISNGACGIVYRPGVWHVGMMVLDTTASFFVVQGMMAEGNDSIAELARPIAIGIADRAP